jgi:RNA polymerase sigma factor (sigma-70 family)
VGAGVSIDADMDRHVPLVWAVVRSLSSHDRTLETQRGQALFAGGLEGLAAALRRFDPEAGHAFPSYAWSWIRGAALREAKRNRVHRELRQVFESHAVVYGADIEQDENREEAQALLAKLPPRLRGVVVALFFEGRTKEALAVDMGLTRQRVSQLLHEALHLMRGKESKPPKERVPAVQKAENGGGNVVEYHGRLVAIID